MRVAITGGIAMGKSTVLAILADMGCTILSADEVARECFAEAEDEISAVAKLPAPLNRNQLRDVLTASDSIRREVNRILHPRIFARLISSPVNFVEIPLLIEGCAQRAFDEVWVVSCSAGVQKARLRERYGSAADIEAILATQLPICVKEAFASKIIRTDEPIEHVRGILAHAVVSVGCS